MVIEITKDNFDAEVMKSDKPILLDFWAAWCGPCKMIAPEIAAIAEEYDGSIKVGKINIDDQGELADIFRIDSIPTVVVMKNGKAKNVSVGYKDKKQIKALL